MAPKKEGKIENEKICAILSYLLIGVIWYFADEKMKKSRFAKFHAKQGLVLIIAELIVYAFWMIPFIGWFFAPILNFALLVLLIIGIINAANDKMNALPVIGSFAEKFDF